MTLYQLGIVVGILAAVFMNMLIQRMGDEAWNVSVGWRWMFFAGVVPAILFGLMILPAVESPRWLMKVGRREQAVAVLTKINGAEAALREAAEIENSLSTEEGPHLGAVHYVPAPLAARYYACGIAADQRNHAGVFLFARDFSRCRHRYKRCIFLSLCWLA